MKRRTNNAQWWVAIAAIIACAIGLSWISKERKNPIAFLYPQAVQQPQVEEMDVGVETTIYLPYSPEEVKQMIADKVDDSWRLTDPRNGNFRFNRGSYQGIYIFARRRDRDGPLPSGARSQVIHLQPSILLIGR